MQLGIDEDELSSCVSCGMCLPHCPTYRVTGKEALSPRGRIDAMRAVQWKDAPVDQRFVEFMETCVQCRGCEPACPSGVPFGHLMEATRATLASTGRTVPQWQRLGYRVLSHHRVLLIGSRLLAVAQRLRLVPRRLGLGPIPLRQGPALTSTGNDVWLYTGCVMDAWQRHTHRSTAAVLTALGVTYQVPAASGCCGALHTHAGLTNQAASLMRATMESFPGDAPILVNSAGCGAALKDIGHLLGTPEAMKFSLRIADIHTFVAEQTRLQPDALRVSQQGSQPDLGPIMIQDPCHLRHVQKAHLPVRELIARVGTPVDVGDDGLCCGAGGAYSALQPGLAGQIRDRKIAAIVAAAQRTGSRCLVSANPGCSQHLSQALAVHGITVSHPIDLVAGALS
jgi:glycolate oxidase iron-sulfur subunit